MNIKHVFKDYSFPLFFFILFLGIANSALSSSMLAFINHAINRKPFPFLPQYDWALFIIVLVVSFFCNRMFQMYITRLTNEVMYRFELGMLSTIRGASYESFEKIGPERIYTAIGDTRVLAQIPQVIVSFISAAIMVICVLCYMFWLSPSGAAGVVGLMISLAVFYIIRNRIIEKDLNRARDMQNDYYKYLKDFLGGFKEVKMSTGRNDRLFNDYLRKVLSGTKNIAVRTANKYLHNELVGSYSWYIILGFVLFAMPRLMSFSPSQVASFMITVLFIMSPVSTLIGAIPFYTRTKIALQRLTGLEEDVRTKLDEDVKQEIPLRPYSRFGTILFDRVGYTYYDRKNRKTFELDPITLQIDRGEVIFVTGGNGSGKSTFVNLLTGLYKPGSGAIYLNDQEIKEEDYSYYRNNISVIFTNNYLFNENYDGFDLGATNAQLSAYLDLFRLNTVVQFEDEKKRIDKNLSKGQQKRLAMIYLLLENKDIIVLDEWAAEQDPSFRAYFYKHLIPELKKKGKTVIAVTHDDAYYSYADRVIRFDYGKIISDECPAPLLANSVNF
jgi:cyclic peptide transporter